MSTPPFAPEVLDQLAQASVSARSRRANGRVFVCEVFSDPEWNTFVEHWAPVIYDFLGHALGPYGKEPLPEILKMHDGEHSAGATASFNPSNGQIQLATSVEGKTGQTLEKLCHEMVHASLALFPDGESPFYTEGFVDFSTWTLAHAPVWGEHRESMIEAAAFNIKMRRERALKTHTDYDAKRWAGGLYASLAYGPFLIARLRQKKFVGDLTW